MSVWPSASQRVLERRAELVFPGATVAFQAPGPVPAGSFTVLGARSKDLMRVLRHHEIAHLAAFASRRAIPPSGWILVTDQMSLDALRPGLPLNERTSGYVLIQKTSDGRARWVFPVSVPSVYVMGIFVDLVFGDRPVLSSIAFTCAACGRPAENWCVDASAWCDEHYEAAEVDRIAVRKERLFAKLGRMGSSSGTRSTHHAREVAQSGSRALPGGAIGRIIEQARLTASRPATPEPAVVPKPKPKKRLHKKAPGEGQIGMTLPPNERHDHDRSTRPSSHSRAEAQGEGPQAPRRPPPRTVPRVQG